VQPAGPLEVLEEGEEEVPLNPGILTLEQAIAIALKRNPDIAGAAARTEVAKYQVKQAASAFYPRIGGRLGYIHTDNPAQAFGMIVAQRDFWFGIDVNDPGPTESWRPEIFAQWSVYRGGQDMNRAMAGVHGVFAREYQRMAVRDAIVTGVVDLFYAILAAREQVGVARASVETIEAEKTKVQARFESGAALKSDLLSLDVRLAAAREGLIRAENGAAMARAGLGSILDMQVEEAVDLIPPEDPGPDLPSVPLDHAIAVAFTKRPELRATRQAALARERELRAARGAYMPTLSAFGSYGQDAHDLRLSQQRDNWLVGAQLEIDLFAGFRNVSRVDEAEQQLREAEAMVRKTRLDVEREVRTTYLSLVNAKERVRVTEAAVAQAEEALRLVREQYEAGTSTVTRYLETELALTEARSMQIAARYDVMRARAAYRKAVGDVQ
jgi:outer membrane protein TolC